MGTGTSKCNIEQIEDIPEDRLSTLPDEILTKILSHLTTKEVVRTEILSKQWKSVWESVPDFELIDDYFRQGENHHVSYLARFSNFVDRVLVGRKSWLRKIRIKTSTCIDSNVMELRMLAAIKRHVNELDVDFLRRGDDAPWVLTSSLFACNSLTVLKLHANMFLDIPTTTSPSFLPNLKILELCNVSYQDDFSLPNMLSNCPILRELHIVKPQWRNMTTLNITSRSLKRLLVKCTFQDYEEPEPELKTIVINVPDVESLDISCGNQKYFVATDMFFLEEAKLDLNGVSTACLYNFLKRVSHAKFLTLKPETTLSLLNAGSSNISMFHNLSHLTFYGVDEAAYTDDCIINSTLWEWELLVEILKNSPNLETLIILENYTFELGGYDRVLYRSRPHCLLWSLKTVEFNFYDYSNTTEGDLELIDCFTLNAAVLKTIRIRSPSGPMLSIFAKSNIEMASERYLKSSTSRSEKEIVISFH